MKKFFEKLKERFCGALPILILFGIPTAIGLAIFVATNWDNLKENIFTIIVTLVQIIVAMIVMGVVVVLLIKDLREREREDYAEWVSRSITIIHCIEHQFQRDCQEIITNAFSERNVMGGIVVGKYREEITALEKEYKNNLSERIYECGTHRIPSVTSVPKYMEEEYERNISEIADTFRHFGDFMSEQIKDISKGDYRWKMIY